MTKEAGSIGRNRKENQRTRGEVKRAEWKNYNHDNYDNNNKLIKMMVIIIIILPIIIIIAVITSQMILEMMRKLLLGKSH